MLLVCLLSFLLILNPVSQQLALFLLPPLPPRFPRPPRYSTGFFVFVVVLWGLGSVADSSSIHRPHAVAPPRPFLALPLSLYYLSKTIYNHAEYVYDVRALTLSMVDGIHSLHSTTTSHPNASIPNPFFKHLSHDIARSQFVCMSPT